MFDFDISKATRDHDGFVITTHTFAGRHFKGSKVASQVGASKLVIKRSGSERTISHDLKRRHNAIRLAVIQLPGAWVLR